MLFQNAISLFTVFAEIMPHMIPGLSTSEQHLNYNTGGKKKQQNLTEVGEIFPGWRPIPARVLASSTAFTPQFGATFAWHRMCTFILHTGGKRRRDPHWERSRVHGGCEKELWEPERLWARNCTGWTMPFSHQTKLTQWSLTFSLFLFCAEAESLVHWRIINFKYLLFSPVVTWWKTLTYIIF